MIPRRALMLGAGFAMAGGAAQAGDGVPKTARLAFRVLRNEREIGRTSLAFSRDGDQLEVHIATQVTVTFGPITVYRYHHAATEGSRAGQFVSLAAQTDDDGTLTQVSARREGAQVIVEATGRGRQQFAADARPLTHWNRACMNAPLFSPEDGKPIRLTAALRGPETVALDGGASITATRYALTGQSILDDWYDADDQWVALRAVAKDGSIITYRRIA